MIKRDEETKQQDNTTTAKEPKFIELTDELLREVTGGAQAVEVKLIDTDLTCGSYNF